MDKDLENSIQQLVNKQEQLIDLTITPYDYPSLQQQILLLELRQEIKGLKDMLATPKTFVEAFKKQCKFREADRKQTIPFSEVPESITNQLYWDIATHLFHPKSIQEMLKIILPSVSKQLTVSFSEHLSDYKSLKNHKENANFKLEQKALPKEFPDSLTITELRHYVVLDHMLFDVRAIKHFDLSLHIKLKAQLDKNYSALAKRIYAHNTDFQNLALDLTTYNGQGLPPRQAIERLRQKLILAGTAITGRPFASPSVAVDIFTFMSYFKSLPQPIQYNLKALKINNNYTLGDIFDKEIAQGECVETTANNLKLLLNNNAKNLLLDTPPQMITEYLKVLKQKYQNKHTNGLSSLKGKDHLSTLMPNTLTHEAIKKITPKSIENLIDLMIAFPPKLYEVLWQNLTLNKPATVLKQLASAIKEDFFNSEQKHELAKAIAKYYSRFNVKQTLLHWSIDTNDSTVLKYILDIIPKADRVKAITTADKNGQTVLHYAAEDEENEESLKTLLEFIPKEDRVKAITTADKNHQPVLYYAANIPESLETLLGFIPKEDRVKIITAADKNGQHVLYYVVNIPESLEIFLRFIPEEDRVKIITTTDKSGGTLLHYTTLFPASLKALLGVIPRKDRVKAITTAGNNDQTLLHYVVNIPKSLKILLEAIPKEDGVKAITTAHIYGQAAVNAPKSLEILLEFTPKENRAKIIATTDKNGRTALHYAARTPEFLEALLKFTLKEDRVKTITTADIYGQTVLHNAARTPEALKIIFALLSKNQIRDAISLVNKAGEKNLTSSQSHSAPTFLSDPSNPKKRKREDEVEQEEYSVDNNKPKYQN